MINVFGEKQRGLLSDATCLILNCWMYSFSGGYMYPHKYDWYTLGQHHCKMSHIDYLFQVLFAQSDAGNPAVQNKLWILQIQLSFFIV